MITISYNFYNGKLTILHTFLILHIFFFDLGLLFATKASEISRLEYTELKTTTALFD